MTDAIDRLRSALVDRYGVERELGSGGMANVYLAEDLKLHRKVALKVLRPELASALGPDRFLQEIDIAAKLNYPHILGLFDCGEADGFLYYVMPFVEGLSLRDKLAKDGELPITEAVRILRDVVDALSHAHKHNVVHRDIKPDNVMLTERHALVTDFGVAKAVSDATGAISLTTEGVALGTPAYMAPEQASADPNIDHRADIYAVGVIAYEMLTGRTPFVGATQQELLAAHVTQTPDPVAKYRESVPPALAELVMKCLEKKAADRWQTADELLPQLESMATPSGGVTPTGMVPEGTAKRGWRFATAVGFGVVILAVVLAVTLVTRGSGVALDPERIVVAVLRNETGSPSLDQVGRQAGHWITQGLQQTGIVQVVPWETALQSSRYVSAAADVGRVRDRVQALAEETGAGTVISGAYYRRGDAVHFQLEITDATRSRLLTALEPEKAPFDAPDEAMEPLRQQVMGSLAISFDERISAQASGVAQPPSYEAYQAFDEGMRQYFRLEYREALSYFYQAFQLDTTFVTPLIYAVINHTNLDEWAKADSLVDILEQARNRLSEYDRHWLDYLKARIEGDPAETLDAIRRAAELAPGSKAVYQRGLVAMRHNRPQEAVEALLSLDPERGPMRGWPSYHVVLAHGYLMLEQFDNAQNAVRSGRAAFGDDVQRLAYEAFALTGLGRIEEVNALVNEMIALPEEAQLQGQGWYMRRIAVYLRRHGHLEASRNMIDRAIDWYEGRPPDTKSTRTWRYPYAVALYVADRCDESFDVAKPLSLDFPESYTYRGFVGMVAACRGDREEALDASRWLETLEVPYLYGRDALFRSTIAAALGDGDRAVALWRQATAEGLWLIATTRMIRLMGPGDGRWIAFEAVRNHPDFQELMRPKG